MIDINALTIEGDTSNIPKGEKLEAAIHNELLNLLQTYSSSRQQLEDNWLKSYYAYATTKYAHQALTNTAKQVIGQVRTKWRHNIKSPKGFETVETIVAWLMGAFFPNRKWFDFAPAGHISDPNFRTLLELNRKFVSKKLDEGNFADVYRMMLRETCITGTAAFMFPWNEVEQNSSFSVISCFNLWLDPKHQNPNKCNLIRKYELSKTSVLLNKDFFNLVSEEKLGNNAYANSNVTFDRNLVEHVRRLTGIQETSFMSNDSDTCNIFEFWGDLTLPKYNIKINNVRINFTTSDLLNVMSNPFVHRPIVVTTYVQTAVSPYGISALKPVLPQLYYKDVMTSRHADAVVASVDPTYLMKHDGIVDPTQVYVAPGHVIPVTDMNSIAPVPLGGNLNASVQDMSVIEQSIDKATGTGPFIGVGQGRAAERVTKAEIDAQVAAGGNRLNDVYAHMQVTLLNFITYYRDYFRAYFSGQVAVEVKQLNRQMPLFNQNLWAGVDVEAFQFDVEVKPLGAENVATREFKLRQVFDWLSIVGQNPQFAQSVNWESVLQHITFTMLPDEADFFLAPQPQQPQPQQPAEQIQEVLMNAGAGADVKALESAALAGTLPETIQQVASL